MLVIFRKYIFWFCVIFSLRRYNEETKFPVTPSFVLTHSSDSIFYTYKLSLINLYREKYLKGAFYFWFQKLCSLATWLATPDCLYKFEAKFTIVCSCREIAQFFCKQTRIREIKFDVTWSYVKRQTANGKRQTAKMTSEFVFFSSNPSLNHIKIEKCLLLFATNTNIFTLLFKELKTDGKSFIFAVWRKTT